MKRALAVLVVLLPAACAAFGESENTTPSADAGGTTSDSGAAILPDGGGPATEGGESADGAALLPIPGTDFANGGTTSIADNVLTATIPASGPDGETTALREIRNDGLTGVEVDADYLLDDPGASYPARGTDVALVSVVFGNGDDDAPQGLMMMAGGEPALATTYTLASEPTPTVPLPYGSWFHVHLEVDLMGTGDNGFVHLEIANGAPLVQDGLKRTDDDKVDPVTYIDFGIARYDSTHIDHALTVHVKNVTVKSL